MYLWLKALHIIAVISWMAGLLYLPRLFVYHAAVAPGSEQSETFKTMERRLLKAIMTPAMIATWLFGLSLMFTGGWMAAGWGVSLVMAATGAGTAAVNAAAPDLVEGLENGAAKGLRRSTSKN